MAERLQEIEKLKINLKDTQGALTNKGGKSDNVWGQVAVPMEIIRLADRAMIDGHKSCVWTAYDPAIYSSTFDRNSITPDMLRNRVADIISEEKGITDRKLWFQIFQVARERGIDGVLANEEIMAKVRNIVELEMRGIPSTISATFKSSFSKYSAVVENMSMYMAIALDMPTSYNYLVAFDKDDYPEIVDNYSSSSKLDKLQPIGVVSIDFLQNRSVPEYETELRVKNEEGFWDWITIKKDYVEDELFAFYDSMSTSIRDNLDGHANLVENWINAIHKSSAPYLQDEPDDVRKKRLDNMDSRIVRSTILREFFGDADFTAYNGGTVNHSRYAANFDFGESFNGLIKGLLDPEADGVSSEVLAQLPPDVRDKLLQQQSKPKKTLEEVATTFASDTGEKNLRFIMQKYPHYAREILDNIQNALSNNVFDEIVERYTTMSCNGKPLLTEEEAEIFKKYIRLRGEWLVSMANNMLQNHENENEI